MSAPIQDVFKVAVVFAAAFVALPSADAAPPAGVYCLALSIDDNAVYGFPGRSSVTLNVINTTRKTLVFGCTPGTNPTLKFQVEYSAPRSNPNGVINWQTLKPNTPPTQAQPVPSSPNQSVITQTIEHREKIVISPNRVGRFTVPLDFTMTALGDYRIFGTMTVLQANEYEPASLSTQKRQFTLILHSAPFFMSLKRGEGFAHH